VGGKLHALASLPPRKEPALVVDKAVWTLAPVCTSAKNPAHTNVRTPKHSALACSESLDGIGCPDRLILICKSKGKINPVTDREGPEVE
jgi:hypothetical protein